ncbi:MAG TPA: DUF4827 domain-containing protein [Bacteroides togonis]|jgi:hypothetical protein|uniref:DUF4827 domain-containing protein n=1 Tax=Caecibacteroides pullorum TaxID=2725562 RepID=A0AA41DCB1_9BACT|nr:DUF4827 domain-containing protein [Caecibacteroides pullorum]CCX60913.1 putative uncharacterized protein [Bacteroides sp. CAG:598]HJD93659.1 DUF4827 domain-containing protein [Bacteroides togonis]MBM6857865.1 DUF4827 domain-containing protein [Caecibacteroides pullorum]MBV8040615.1 DUF4827 domain-containing protein [Caecibacteroides pullorum]MBV8058911.1 DUF4827 domain-containing protein [Caecibacteroides pullorum]
MKKLLLLFFILLAVGFSFQACDDTKTYAEMLEEEDDAIADFINKEGIKVISQTEFFDNDSVTDVEKNEFVQLSSGVYMQIVDKGSDNPADTVKNNDLVLVRFMEYSLLDKDTTLSNLTLPYLVDEFKYTASSSSIAGIFIQGLMYMAYGYTAVPAGWLVPLPYVRDKAHVRLIVPSKMGHQSAMQYVYPYYYDITKYQIYK